ncbi:MAG: hypothetical protein M3501_02685 [Actinomycetota bacterium]|nr:hypothetical protein [Actinomycetota bacterium]
MSDLTVLSPQNDPFRIDTPASHRDGQWLADTSRELGVDRHTIHLRGNHYAVIGTTKPNGRPYENTDADWTWLSQKAAKAARWLGYIAFDRIVDQRNTPPVVREGVFAPQPDSWIGAGSMYVELPETAHLSPRAHADGFVAVQPIRLVLIGEKSSLEPVLAPLADRYDADLFLPTGEASDTMIHTMASAAAADGRRLAVLYFSDCDPAGWQMPISVSRKLQALREGFFPDLDFEVRRVALTPDQVREYGLPSTPLKPKEKRADRWRREMGVSRQRSTPSPLSNLICCVGSPATPSPPSTTTHSPNGSETRNAAGTTPLTPSWTSPSTPTT